MKFYLQWARPLSFYSNNDGLSLYFLLFSKLNILDYYSSFHDSPFEAAL